MDSEVSFGSADYQWRSLNGRFQGLTGRLLAIGHLLLMAGLRRSVTAQSIDNECLQP